jgi:hypothetical protein
MEYLDGETLAQRLTKGALPLHEALPGGRRSRFCRSRRFRSSPAIAITTSLATARGS